MKDSESFQVYFFDYGTSTTAYVVIASIAPSLKSVKTDPPSISELKDIKIHTDYLL